MSYQTPEQDLEALKAALIAAFPARVVSRSIKPYTQRADEDLQKGVISFAYTSESEFAHTLGRNVMLGRRRFILVAQLHVAGDEEVLVETEENALAEELKAFFCETDYEVTRIDKSAQAEFPYGWIALQLERLE